MVYQKFCNGTDSSNTKEKRLKSVPLEYKLLETERKAFDYMPKIPGFCRGFFAENFCHYQLSI